MDPIEATMPTYYPINYLDNQGLEVNRDSSLIDSFRPSVFFVSHTFSRCFGETRCLAWI